MLVHLLHSGSRRVLLPHCCCHKEGGPACPFSQLEVTGGTQDRVCDGLDLCGPHGPVSKLRVPGTGHPLRWGPGLSVPSPFPHHAGHPDPTCLPPSLTSTRTPPCPSCWLTGAGSHGPGTSYSCCICHTEGWRLRHLAIVGPGNHTVVPPGRGLRGGCAPTSPRAPGIRQGTATSSGRQPARPPPPPRHAPGPFLGSIQQASAAPLHASWPCGQCVPTWHMPAICCPRQDPRQPARGGPSQLPRGSGSGSRAGCPPPMSPRCDGTWGADHTDYTEPLGGPVTCPLKPPGL